MPDTEHKIECPACGVKLPVFASNTPTKEGMTRTFDETYVDEHVAMHTRCTCLWIDSVRNHDPDCAVHG